MKFPESRSTALLTSAVDKLESQTLCLSALKIPRFPSESSRWELLKGGQMGLSLFATQTTVLGFMFVYHIPIKSFSQSPGQKKPSSNFPCLDTKVFAAEKERICPGNKLSERVLLHLTKESKRTKPTNNIFIPKIPFLEKVLTGRGKRWINNQTNIQVSINISYVIISEKKEKEN